MLVVIKINNRWRAWCIKKNTIAGFVGGNIDKMNMTPLSRKQRLTERDSAMNAKK